MILSVGKTNQLLIRFVVIIMLRYAFCVCVCVALSV